MATACDPTSLVAGAACIECGIPPGLQKPVIIYLLCQIAGMNCDPTSLVAGAACIECGIPPGLADAVIISLLCQIVNNGGAGGSGAPDSINYAGPPILNPPALQNIVVDSNGQQWMYYAAAWH